MRSTLHARPDGRLYLVTPASDSTHPNKRIVTQIRVSPDVPQWLVEDELERRLGDDFESAS